MKDNPVGDIFPEDPIDGSPEHVLEFLSKYGVQNLKYDGDLGRNPGYVFRGEADWKTPLQSGLERLVLAKSGSGLNGVAIRAEEKGTIRKFIEGDGGKVASIFYPNRTQVISDVRDDVFWWLSLIQHYQLPTRLIDFTRDIRIALYFAIEQAEKADNRKTLSHDLIIYCFPCRDPKHPDDPDNNKSPIAPPSSPNEARIDMHRALGTLIGLEWMKSHKRDEKRSQQKFGWDRPHYQNPRIASQRGMFVYPFDDPPTPTAKGHSSWLVQNLDHDDPFNWHGCADPLPAKRIRIEGEKMPLLKRLLAEQYRLTPETIYEAGSRINLSEQR